MNKPEHEQPVRQQSAYEAAQWWLAERPKVFIVLCLVLMIAAIFGIIEEIRSGTFMIG